MSDPDRRRRSPAEGTAAERCPRCGGPPAAPRAPTPLNPFLPSSKRLTCDLCGLEFDKGAVAWTAGDRGDGG
jgi:hypothetical protein